MATKSATKNHVDISLLEAIGSVPSKNQRKTGPVGDRQKHSQSTEANAVVGEYEGNPIDTTFNVINV